MGKPNTGRRLSAGERSAQLMDVALELFIDNGYDGTSMESVARAAGVTKPVIYTYFRSKEELYTDVLKRQQDLFTRARQDDVGTIEIVAFQEGGDIFRPFVIEGLCRLRGLDIGLGGGRFVECAGMLSQHQRQRKRRRQ